eukprot:Skav228379  [mRNA]  locus=scaffold1981:328314:332810:+ [translate_table: standard]
MFTCGLRLQQQSSSSGAGAVVATVGCSVLGMMIAGPVGAVIGGTLAIAATAGASSRGQSVPALHISSISMPESGITRDHGVTYFALDVVDSNGLTWRLLRRYNQFDRLRKELQLEWDAVKGQLSVFGEDPAPASSGSLQAEGQLWSSTSVAVVEASLLDT